MGGLLQLGELALAEELRDRRTPAVSLPMPEHQALCPFGASDLGERVDLLPANSSGDPYSADDAAGVERLAEDLEFRLAEHGRQLLNLEAEAEVGLVHAVPQHGFCVGDATDWCRHSDA